MVGVNAEVENAAGAVATLNNLLTGTAKGKNGKAAKKMVKRTLFLLTWGGGEEHFWG